MSAAVDRLLARFGPVSLAELDRRAELSVRVDRKYIVDVEALKRLADDLGDGYLALEIGGERLHAYDSIYFDTLCLATYRDHLQGRRRRFKSRSRLYRSTGDCFFDVKLKGGRGETVKRRLRLDPLDHGSLTSAAGAFLARELGVLYGCRPPEGLRPTLRTEFNRLTLVDPEREERLTCDFAVSLASTGGTAHRIRAGHVLLETKTPYGVGHVERLLRLGVRPAASCTKYCLGVALNRPGLPTNVYRPLLRRYFGLPAQSAEAARA